MSKPLVVLGVTGGIAAYKSAEIIRRLKDEEFDVQVIATPSALKFIGETTLAALSGHEVISNIWDKPEEVKHVQIAKKASVILVAPATADFIAHLANGFADNALLATLLTTKSPVLIAPAMHTEMWENFATQENIKKLKARGVLVIDPAVGQLTSEDVGIGRLPEAIELVKIIKQIAIRNSSKIFNDLTGLKVLISAGGTREAIDPIRFIGNRASGKQGLALASAAFSRGAKVTVVGANITEPIPAGINFITANSASQMQDEMLLHSYDSDVILMNAAVADFYIENPSQIKIKKDKNQINLELKQTQDILLNLAKVKKDSQLLVGFAAETVKDIQELMDLAKKKYEAKKCDVLLANPVSHLQGMDQNENEFVMIAREKIEILGKKDKLSLSHDVWDHLSVELAKLGLVKSSPVEPDLE